jgi:outer membrane protein OmpA-like peptidoglycan-associated protein
VAPGQVAADDQPVPEVSRTAGDKAEKTADRPGRRANSPPKAGSGPAAPGSTVVAAGCRAPVAVLTPRAVIDLQRRAGNTAVQRWLTVQRQVPDVAPIVRLMPELDACAVAVSAEAARWDSFRTSGQAPVPGEAAFRAATQCKDTIQARHRDDPENNPSYRDPRIATYLKGKLTVSQQLVSEMCSFGTNAKGLHTLSAGSADCALLFGLPTKMATHNYTCRVNWTSGFKAGFGFIYGVQYRSVNIEYSNDLGMKWSKELDLVSGMGGGGAALKGAPGKGVSRGGGPKANLSGEGTGEDSAASYWFPEDFEGGFFAAKAAASVALPGLGGANLKGEGAILKFILFPYRDQKGQMAFDLLGGKSYKLSPSGELGKPGFAFGAGAGLELEAGYAFGGELRSEAPEIEEEGTGRRLGEEKLESLNSLFFDTGIAKLDPAALDMVDIIGEALEKAIERDPDIDIRLEITGHASPRWRHPQKGRIPLVLNAQLAEDRAANTAAALRGRLGGHSGATQVNPTGVPGPEQELEDAAVNATVGSRGSLDALGEGADPDSNYHHHRRVDVAIYIRAFAEGAEEATP